MNKALRTVALFSVIAFEARIITCIVMGSGEAYGYICAIWWAGMFLMFGKGDEGCRD